LNALAVGEDTAASVGIDVHRLRNQILVIVTAMVAITVGPVGIIGFIGLVAPHIARSLVGVDLRKTLPLSAIAGSSLLLASDAIAQRGPQGTELPVGIVTAILGAPSLLILMRRR
jgi:iron complex transport system permease protein